MLSCFINFNRIALLANIITSIALAEPSGSYIACPSAATSFAFIDTPNTEKLLLSLQQEEDPDEEPGKTVPPN